IYHRADRGGAGCEPDADPESSLGPRHGCCRMHRLWRLCRGLSKRRGAAVHVGEAGPPQFASPGPAGTLGADHGDGRHHGAVLRQLHELWRMRSGLSKRDRKNAADGANSRGARSSAYDSDWMMLAPDTDSALFAAFTQARPAPPKKACGGCREFVEDAEGGRGTCLHPGSGVLSPWTDTEACA